MKTETIYATKDLKTILLVTKLDGNKYETAFTHNPINLNKTIEGKGLHCVLHEYDCIVNNLHNMFGLVCIIPKGTKIVINQSICYMHPEKLIGTGQLISDMKNYKKTTNSLDFILDYFSNQIPKDKISIGWFVLRGDKFIHPSEYTKDHNVVGVVGEINNDTIKYVALARLIIRGTIAQSYNGDWKLLTPEDELKMFYDNAFLINSSLIRCGGHILKPRIYWSSEKRAYCNTYTGKIIRLDIDTYNVLEARYCGAVCPLK